MSPFAFATIILLLASLCSLVTRWRAVSNRWKDGREQPPGPRGLPIIGNLHMLGSQPHRSLSALAKKYGPIMFLRLGNKPVIVVSSPESAKLFLKTHDMVFASRPNNEVVNRLSYGLKGLIFSPYGAYWRSVRKFCTLELLTASRIDSKAGMRREEIERLVELLKVAAAAEEVVNVSKKVAELMEDLTYRILFGGSRVNSLDLKVLVKEVSELAGTFNLADYVPLLKGIDLQGLSRRSKAANEAIDNILETIIQERQHESSARSSDLKLDKDFLDVMLSLEDRNTRENNTHDELSHVIDRSSIKAILLDMIGASIDTSHNTIEWILSELIIHPNAMKRLHEELKSVVGLDQMVEEMHLPKLEYLNMVMKETFRLHPVVPFLIHEAMEDVVVNGFYIPKKTQVMVNLWALGRDSDVWKNDDDNVQEFVPERFIGCDLDVWGGNDFELIPFGSGRRKCPGMQLGLVTVRLTVAQLVHCFDWKLPPGSDDLDMSESFALTMPRAQHLLAMPTYRLYNHKLI